ncbi:glycosyl transferase family 2 [Chthoniobacter flavus Ellin428]|uniref:Glycosyl transferase family 2 n=1 Tax=Chthoniobacter flavus Ellin428 TaxID=497964 RepID=B4D2E1_9BACT|nr:glycosyltransferase [Chthoniobacter flavus]EDY19381.1 glycosyl transferase family 2 [Chthoniobacter flavus Ellin428]TCO90491.1 glycosyl transferase family 2 [Chthoniobacter flavus]
MSMTAASPLVTVLLPVRNGSAHLPAALESIFAQTFRDFELLVIDDGSTDSTPEILSAVQDPRLRVVTNPQNIGLVPALNRGLEMARGEFVARQDHDDVSLPERLQKQVDYLRTHAGCVLVGTEATQTDGQGRRMYRLLRPHGAEDIRWYLCFDNAFIHSSVMFRREVVRQVFGGYAPSFHSEDYALWSRIARSRETANLPEPLLLYREHSSSVTQSMSAADEVRFEEATGAIRRENLRALLGGETNAELNDIEERAARVLSSYRRDFNAASVNAFLEVLEKLLALKFRPGNFGAEVVPAEYRRVVGMQHAELAYRTLPVARWKALELFRRALELYPGLGGMLPWVRIAALFLLGENARKLVRRLTKAAGALV